MTTESAKSQGIFVPNWWLAILLVPVLMWSFWMSTTVRDIAKDQATARELAAERANTAAVAIGGLKDTVEFRLRNIETQGKLNDEHLRLMENRLARIEGKKGIQSAEEQ